MNILNVKLYKNFSAVINLDNRMHNKTGKTLQKATLVQLISERAS